MALENNWENSLQAERLPYLLGITIIRHPVKEKINVKFMTNSEFCRFLETKDTLRLFKLGDFWRFGFYGTKEKLRMKEKV